MSDRGSGRLRWHCLFKQGVRRITLLSLPKSIPRFWIGGCVGLVEYLWKEFLGRAAGFMGSGFGGLSNGAFLLFADNAVLLASSSHNL